MKHAAKVIILFSLLFSLKGYGQARLSIVSLVNFPDTTTFNTTVPLMVVVQNTGTAIYQGSIQVVYSLTPSGAINYLYFNAGSVVVFPGDTVNLTPANGFTIDSTSGFRAGNNVVVVWPYTTQGIMVDSMTITTYVDTSTISAVNEIGFPGLHLYPVPAKEYLIAAGLKGVEYVRIMSVLGSELFSSLVNSDRLTIDLKRYPRGLYIAEFRNREGEHRYIRFTCE